MLDNGSFRVIFATGTRMETKRKREVAGLPLERAGSEGAEVIFRTKDGVVGKRIWNADGSMSFVIHVPEGKRKRDILAGIGSVLEVQRPSTIAEVVASKAVDGMYTRRVRFFGDRVRQVASSGHSRWRPVP